MGGQDHMHLVVAVEPLWVVVHLLSPDCYLSHPSKCRDEIFENKLLLNDIPGLVGCPDPIRNQKSLEMCCNFLLTQFRTLGSTNNLQKIALPKLLSWHKTFLSSEQISCRQSIFHNTKNHVKSESEICWYLYH